MKIVVKYICIIFCLAISSGCAFSDLKKDLEKQESFVLFKGEVVVKREAAGPIVVALVMDDPFEPVLVNYKVIASQRDFSMYAREGRYRIFAYEDRNRDLHYQPDERIGHSSEVVLEKDQETYVVISLPDMPDAEIARTVEELRRKGKVKFPNRSVRPGAIVSLDSEIFSDKNIKMGLWQPLKAATEVPIGIFLLEEYDSEKKPVFFVHGVSGSPKKFEALIAGIDKDSFQALVAYYPSGFRIPLIAAFLESQLLALQVKYNFQTLSLVAHSMGGLVSRALINRLLQNGSSFKVDRFISISTPWNGHVAAASGVKWAPAVIPVWYDMSPGSEFLTTLIKNSLPVDIPHYLLFSFQGTGRFAGGNSDGVVGIASQLRPEVQEAAALVRGYDQDHITILSHGELIAKVNSLLVQ